ncbi:MAG TPA: SRPBCC domain-containing protein [Gaiellales bacterium]|jgi:hypothetical protein
MSREFEIRREVELPGTPEQVFAAVATGNGTAGWMFPTGEGAPSQVGEEFAGHRVTVLDPPNHFAVRAEGEDGSVNSLDYRIERRGSGALLRYVHSGVITDDWDTQYDGADRHTDFYLHSLGEYLAHFAGRDVTYVGADGPKEALGPEAFAAVRAALGVREDGAVGDRVDVELPGIGRLRGEVDYLDDMFIGVRADDALYRFYGRGSMGMPVFAGHHLFAPGVDGPAAQAAWEAWLAGVIA